MMPVIGTSVTTTAMLMNAWMHSQPVMPAASRAPNVSGAASATRAPEYARSGEQRDDDDRPDQPELLADLGEDEVVEGVRDRHQALAEAAPDEPAGAERQQALDGVEAGAQLDRTTGRARSGCAPSGSPAGRRDGGQRRRRRGARRRWTRLAPATKNIVNAVRRDDRGRAQVRLLEHEQDDRARG